MDDLRLTLVWDLLSHRGHINARSWGENTTHAKKYIWESFTDGGGMTADKQGVCEDLRPQTRGSVSPRPPHQNCDLVLGVRNSCKSPGQLSLCAKRHCGTLPLGLVWFSLRKQWWCRCKLLALVLQLVLVWQWNMEKPWGLRSRTHAHYRRLRRDGCRRWSMFGSGKPSSGGH